MRSYSIPKGFKKTRKYEEYKLNDFLYIDFFNYNMGQKVYLSIGWGCRWITLSLEEYDNIKRFIDEIL